MKKIRNIVLVALVITLPAAWMTMSVLNEAKVKCQVCMSFHGGQNCGKALGSDKDSCIHTAKDNACALIASGMAASIQCSQQDPQSVDIK